MAAPALTPTAARGHPAHCDARGVHDAEKRAGTEQSKAGMERLDAGPKFGAERSEIE